MSDNDEPKPKPEEAAVDSASLYDQIVETDWSYYFSDDPEALRTGPYKVEKAKKAMVKAFETKPEEFRSVMNKLESQKRGVFEEMQRTLHADRMHFCEDKISFQGREFCKRSTLTELQELEKELRETSQASPSQNSEYKSLLSWIDEKQQKKEAINKRVKEEWASALESAKTFEDTVSWKGREYNQDMELSELKRLDQAIKESPKEERLPYREYQKLWSWIATKDKDLKSDNRKDESKGPLAETPQENTKNEGPQKKENSALFNKMRKLKDKSKEREK